ncbi:MAG: type II toxin-antitoxin system RelE/ParE family toxin [Bacteroidota bacterium]
MPERYRVEIKRSAAKEIRAISHARDRERVISRIQGLDFDPRPAGCVKLSGRDAYRARQGTFRIVYTIQNDLLVVEVVRVAYRRYSSRS